jgi:mRNA interferase MazF
MRRGDVYFVDFEPSQNSETNKVRPAVIVSSDAGNRAAERLGRGVITVVPLTSNVKRVYPFQLLLSAADCGLQMDSKAQAEQVRAVSISRFRRRLGAVPAPLLRQLDDVLRQHLSL